LVIMADDMSLRINALGDKAAITPKNKYNFINT